MTAAERFDFVVAGSGAGGACVAGRLAAGGARVLVLERGPRALPQADALEAVRRYYVSGGFVSALGNAMIPIPTGSAVGGTTTINSGTCLRTPRELALRWQARLGGGFDAADFSARVEQAWELLKVRPAPPRSASACSRLFLEGLARRGIRGGALLERCEDGCKGSGRCCFVCPEDAKMTADRAFLRDPAASERLELRERTELLSVAAPRRPGEPVRLVARPAGGGPASRLECGTLILAAGTLATPYFVRAFRLGPEWRRAGDALSLHPAVKLFALFGRELRGWEGVPQGAGLLDPEDGALRYEGVFTPPELAALTFPLEGARLRWWLERYARVATFGFMIRDEGRGSVRYPLGPRRPLIRYHLTMTDFRRMLRGMRFLGETFFAAGAERVVVPLNREGCELAAPAGEADAPFAGARPRELQTMAFHPLGTCGLGRVVDADLRLCPGVYACDGSVVPESLGVNPQITIYAFALRLAARLLGSAA